MPVYPDGPGRYLIRYDAPRGADGRRRQIVRRGFRTKKDAEAALRQAQAAADQGLLPARGKLTLSAYLDEWLEMIRPNLAARTWASYDDACRLHIRPAIGAVRMEALNGLHVQQLLARVRAAGVSELRARYVYRVLSMALRRAVTLLLIPRSPCDGVPAPRPETPRPRVLTPDQAVTLLESCVGTWLYLPVVLAITCGLRRGEVLALRWSDVDFERGMLMVSRAVELLHGQVTLKAPKTHHAAPVGLPASVLEDLRVARISAPPGDGYIVCEPDGSLTKPNRLTSRFRAHCQRLGLDISFHGLRHTQATILLASGVPERVAMERMRHRTREMLTLYSHVLPVMRDDAAERVDQALRRGRREGPREAD